MDDGFSIGFGLDNAPFNIDLLDPSNAPYTDHQWEYFFFTMAPERFRNRSRAYEWAAERRAELATGLLHAWE